MRRFLPLVVWFHRKMQRWLLARKLETLALLNYLSNGTG
jgi:hypothetical protein